MPNLITLADGLTREALFALETNYGFSATVGRGIQQNHFGFADPKEGATLRIRLPNQYRAYRSWDYVDDYVEERTYEVKVTKAPFYVPLTITDEELALDITDFNEMLAIPAGIQLATEVDWEGTGIYKKVWNQIGDPLSTPEPDDFWDAAAVLVNNNVPRNQLWHVILSPNAAAGFQKSTQTLFNPANTISSQYRTGIMGQMSNFIFSEEQNTRVHSTGNYGTSRELKASLVNGTPSITLDAFVGIGIVTSDPGVNEGDILSVDGIYAINEKNRQNTGRLQQFVATADGTWNDSQSELTVPIAPTPDASTMSQWQNITSLGTAGNPVHLYGEQNSQYTVNMAYHKDAFLIVTPRLHQPGGLDISMVKEYKKNYMRFTRQYESRHSRYVTKLEVMAEFDCPRPQMAVRIASQV